MKIPFSFRKKYPALYFLHIPKTAGSSLSAIIRSAYPTKSVLPVHELPDLLRMKRDEINQYTCFIGHFGAGFFQMLDLPVLGVTMLRDPFERAISALHYARKIYLASGMPRMSEERKKFVTDKGIISLSDIRIFDSTIASLLDKGDFMEMLANPWLARVIENRQTLYLGYDVDISPTSVSPESMLNWSRHTDNNLEYFFVNRLSCGFDVSSVISKAERRLDQMDVVGIAEHFERSAQLVCNLLGLDVPKLLPRENIASARKYLQTSTYRQSGVPKEVAKRIDQLTEIDRHIYEYGCSVFMERSKLLDRKSFFFGRSSTA